MSFAMRHVRGFLSVLCFVFLAAPASAHSFKLGALEIGHPWARETPVSATVGAAYLSVKNAGAEADRLIAVETLGAEKVEMHESTNENGVAKMRQVEAIEIPAGGDVSLNPGGYHLMLVGLKEALAEGERIPATLIFEKSGKIDVEFAVENMGYGGPGGAKHDAMPAEHKH
jgi:copper(I)-binding protein